MSISLSSGLVGVPKVPLFAPVLWTVVVTDEDDKVTQRDRPWLIQAVLGNHTSPKGAPPHASAYIDTRTGKHYPMRGLDRGHLIARRFLGSGADISVNIVPLHPTFNRKGGVWSELEETLAKVVAFKITLTIEVEYLIDPLVPSALVVTAQAENGSYVNFKDVALNKLKFTHNATLPVQVLEGDLIENYGVDAGLADALLAEIKKYKDGKPVYDVHKKGPSLYVGGEIENRVYSFVDWLYIEGSTSAVRQYLGATISNGQKFSSEQQALIKMVNRLRNDGWLKSDDPSDPLAGQALTEGNGPSAANIDHMHPKGKSGCNAFSNARLTSQKSNQGKSDSYL